MTDTRSSDVIYFDKAGAAQMALRRRQPEMLWLVVAWVFAGPLNISLLGWFLAIQVYGVDAGFITIVMWFIVVISSIGAAIGLSLLGGLVKTFWRILRMALVISAICAAMVVLPLSAAALFEGLTLGAIVFVDLVVVAAIVALPAAIGGALIIRVTVFQWKRPKKSLKKAQVSP